MLEIADLLARIALFVFGGYIIIMVISSAVRTFVLPRAAFVPLSALVFRSVYVLFDWRARRKQTYEERDAVMAMLAPVALLALPLVWLVLLVIGYMLIFWAIGVPSLYESFSLAGSSLLTLGFTKSDLLPNMFFEFSAAAIGLIMVAILISYLPTMYGAFSRRETLVTLLETRAGTPPSAAYFITLAQSIEDLELVNEIWQEWATWFAELDETHTSLVALVFFRSPRPDRSWVTAAGVILDTASIMLSSVDVTVHPDGQLMIRSGYLALRHIADYFGVSFDADPKPTDPISISQIEFNEMLDMLAAANVPLKPDREQAWRDFAGWRVNYDRPLLALAGLTMAPYAPWVSDRSLPDLFAMRSVTPGLLGNLAARFNRRRQAVRSRKTAPSIGQTVPPG